MMPKGIKMPGYPRHVVKGLLQPPQTHSHLINEVLVIDSGFLGSTPASISKLYLTILYQLLHPFFLFLRCLVPPPVQKGHLHNCELVFRMLCQFCSHSVQHILNSSRIYGSVGPVKVLIYCLQPSDVIVRVRNEMDHNRIVDI